MHASRPLTAAVWLQKRRGTGILKWQREVGRENLPVLPFFLYQASSGDSFLSRLRLISHDPSLLITFIITFIIITNIIIIINNIIVFITYGFLSGVFVCPVTTETALTAQHQHQREHAAHEHMTVGGKDHHDDGDNGIYKRQRKNATYLPTHSKNSSPHAKHPPNPPLTNTPAPTHPTLSHICPPATESIYFCTC